MINYEEAWNKLKESLKSRVKHAHNSMSSMSEGFADERVGGEVLEEMQKLEIELSEKA